MGDSIEELKSFRRVLLVGLAMFFLGIGVLAVSVQGFTVNDTLIRSNGLDLQFNITYPIVFNNVTVDSAFIYFGGLNQSSISQSGVYHLSFTVNETGANYTEAALPYLSVNTNSTKTIVSGLADPINLTLTSSVSDCSRLSNFYFTPASGTRQPYTTFSCSGDVLTLNLTPVKYGVNVVDFNFTIPFYNCTNNTNATINLAFFDEDTPANRLVASVEMDVNYWVNPYFNNSFRVALSGSNNYSLCTDFGNVDADLYVKYNTTGGYNHRYYVYGQNFTRGVPVNYSLYNYPSTTGKNDLKITVKHQTTYGDYVDIVASLQRFYVSEGVWRTVQMDKSGDFGLLAFNIREKDTDYRLIYRKTSNEVLKTTSTLKFICDPTTDLCELTQLLPESGVTASNVDLSYGYAYNNETGNITVTWNDVLGGTSSFRMLVTKEFGSGTVTICDQTQTGSAGTMSCYVGGYSKEVLLQLYSSASPERPVVSAWVKITDTVLGRSLGAAEGAFWSAAILITVAGFGLINAVFAIVAAVFGLIIIYFLGLFTPLTVTFIVIAAVMGIAIGVKVKQ